jgi:hypothetical protein
MAISDLRTGYLYEKRGIFGQVIYAAYPQKGRVKRYEQETANLPTGLHSAEEAEARSRRMDTEVPGK